MTRLTAKNTKSDATFSNISLKSSMVGLVLVSIIVVTAIAVAMPDHYKSHIKLKLRTALIKDQKYAFIERPEADVADVDSTRALQEEEVVQKRLQTQKLQEQYELFQQFQQFQAQANSGNFIQPQGVVVQAAPVGQVVPAAGQSVLQVVGQPAVAGQPAGQLAVAGQPASQPAVVGQPAGQPALAGQLAVAGQPVAPAARQPVAPVAVVPGQPVGVLPAAGQAAGAAPADVVVAADQVNTDGTSDLHSLGSETEEDAEQSQAEYKSMLRKMIDEAVKDTIPLPDKEIDQMAKQISKEIPFVLNAPPHKAWKTPCWMSQKKLMCLPSVYVLGFKRCAYKDLYYRITAHSQLIFSWRAEAQFWSRDSAMGLKETMLNYGANVFLKGMFDKGQVLVEGMADPLWDQLYMNETSRPIPRSLLNAQLAKKFTPDAKFVAILRSPTDSAASFYVYLRRPDPSTPEDFHKNIGDFVKQYKTCVKENGYDPCFGNGYLHENLLYWTYIMYLKDWLAVFPREQFFFIKMEEWADPRKRMFVLRDLFKFLGVRKTPPKTLQLLAAMHRVNDESRRWYNSNLKTMLPESRKMLDDFYAPFNEALSDLVGDERFKWDDEVVEIGEE